MIYNTHSDKGKKKKPHAQLNEISQSKHLLNHYLASEKEHFWRPEALVCPFPINYFLLLKHNQLSCPLISSFSFIHFKYNTHTLPCVKEIDSGNHKEGWVLKNGYFRTVLLEKTLESFLDSKEIKPVNLKGNQPGIVIERTDAEAEAPILCPPDAKSQLIGKDPDAEKDWRQEEEDDRGWGGWMASLTQWTWVWASSGRWWRTGKHGVLQSMGSQQVGHDWETELMKEKCIYSIPFLSYRVSFILAYSGYKESISHCPHLRL